MKFREGTNEHKLLRFLESWAAQYARPEVFVEIATNENMRLLFVRSLRIMANFLEDGGRLQAPRKVGQ